MVIANRLEPLQGFIEPRGAGDHRVGDPMDSGRLRRDGTLGIDASHVALFDPALDKPNGRELDDRVDSGVESCRLEVDGHKSPGQ